MCIRDRRFGDALKAASVDKHKSWYVFLTVWVVPRQMTTHGDLWAFGTSPVEQRSLFGTSSLGALTTTDGLRPR
eukprot:3737709-Prymnesium_polylepis.1